MLHLCAQVLYVQTRSQELKDQINFVYGKLLFVYGVLTDSGTSQPVLWHLGIAYSSLALVTLLPKQLWWGLCQLLQQQQAALAGQDVVLVEMYLSLAGAHSCCGVLQRHCVRAVPGSVTSLPSSSSSPWPTRSTSGPTRTLAFHAGSFSSRTGTSSCPGSTTGSTTCPHTRPTSASPQVLPLQGHPAQHSWEAPAEPCTQLCSHQLLAELHLGFCIKSVGEGWWSAAGSSEPEGAVGGAEILVSSGHWWGLFPKAAVPSKEQNVCSWSGMLISKWPLDFQHPLILTQRSGQVCRKL